ncbi:dUTP diphosphatase [Agrobacterium sp. CMT1]|uniref:dUTP diphosphatase n=1 Tax=Agrobacterium sp. CMT1 TaxID=3128901 RepID=UPI003076E838
MSKDMRVKIAFLHAQAKLPEFKTPGAVGADIFAAFDGPPITLAPWGRAKIPTGLALYVPDGLEAQIRSRSGLAFHEGVIVMNSPGTIDRDYRGEVGVILINTSQTSYDVLSGDRIAQMVIAPVLKAEFEIAVELGSTARGEDGFGSTGMR